MRKALVIGIDYYEHLPSLHGCVGDAFSMKHVLDTDADGEVNFDVRMLGATDQRTALKRADLKDEVFELFRDDPEVALLYFAGHGHIDAAGGYLCASDCQRGDDGLALSEVLTYANKSRARNRVILLDSCHAGIAGASPGADHSELREGMTILAATTAEQYATEENGSGLFTSLMVNALDGAAANLRGDVTPGSVYAHVDQSLGSWRQRPVFKTNVKQFISLRRAQPLIDLSELKRIASLFPSPGFEFALNPSFEPESRGRPEGAAPPEPANTAVFSVLQRYNRLGLLRPVGAEHMWHAAIESKRCKLTAHGEHWRRLVADGLV